MKKLTIVAISMLVINAFAAPEECAVFDRSKNQPKVTAVEYPPLSKQCCNNLFKPDGIVYQLYGECLYLQPNGTQTYYGAEANGINPTYTGIPSIVSPDWTIFEINPDYHLGFDVGADMSFNSPNIDIKLNWERVHSSDSDSTEVPPANGFMAGPFFDIGPNSAAYKVARGKVTSHFDEANLRIGKQFCFFNNFYTHFYGGAGFLRIYETLRTQYSNAAASTSRTIETSSTFTGGGPQIGVDYKYRISKGFFFNGSSVLPFFMGQMKNGTTYTSYSPHLNTLGYPNPNIQTTTVPNKVQLIPGFEQKLGFSYIAAWNRVRATLEVGYQCQIYLNAVQTIDMATQAVPTTFLAFPDVGVFAQGFEQNNSNYMLTGPYGSLAFEF